MLPLIAAATKLLPFVAAVPEVIRAFGGEKQAAAADRIVGAAQFLTGQADPDRAVDAIAKDPALQAELVKVLSAERLEFERLALADRQGARQRDVEVRKLTGGRNRRADVMLIAAFVGVIAIAGFVTWISLAGLEAKAGLAIGFLTTIGGMFARNIGTAFDFEFGSSRSSRDKDDLIAGRK
jgi:hypothetical protein